MPESIQIRAGGAELIELTKPLWEKQKTYHLGIDRLSPENYVDLSFEERAIRIQKKGAHLTTLLAKDRTTDHLIGYSLATINLEGVGEIDSVFVEENYRGKGVGTALIKATLVWMEENKVQKTKLHVLDVNQSAVSLYRTLGFEPRMVEMIRRPSDPE